MRLRIIPGGSRGGQYMMTAGEDHDDGHSAYHDEDYNENADDR